MKTDLVSNVITDEDFNAIKQKIVELETQVSAFAIELHIDNKPSLGILGDRSIPFTEHTFMLATERPEILPKYVDMEEFKKDIDLYKKCKELLKLVEIVHERIMDTHIAAGADAFSSARKIYNNVKNLVKINAPGVSVIYDELKKRYKKSKSNEGAETNTEKPLTTEKKDSVV
jgi:hypothetical protein